MDSRKTVFLTGATGNMGREAVKRIAAERDRLRLRVLVRPEERDHPVVRDIKRRQLAEIVWGDLTDATSIREGVKGADIVLREKFDCVGHVRIGAHGHDIAHHHVDRPHIARLRI